MPDFFRQGSDEMTSGDYQEFEEKRNAEVRAYNEAHGFYADEQEQALELDDEED